MYYVSTLCITSFGGTEVRGHKGNQCRSSVLPVLHSLSHLTFATTLQHNFIIFTLQEVEFRLRETK